MPHSRGRKTKDHKESRSVLKKFFAITCADENCEPNKTTRFQQKQRAILYFLHGHTVLWIIVCPIQSCCFLPAEVLRGRTGSGSEAPSTLGGNPGTTAVAVLISLSRLLTPWVDSFHRLPMPCVDSLRRLDTEGPPPRVTPPFRSLLSMLMANKMEFRPEECRREGGAST